MSNAPIEPTAATTEAMSGARRIAIESGDPCVGLGHILLGILEAREGSGYRALVHTGIDLQVIATKARSHSTTKLDQVDPSGAELHDALSTDVSGGNLPLTNEAQAVVLEAQKEVARMESPQMDTGHLLLAILRNRTNAISKTLGDLGIDYDVVDHTLSRP